MDNRVDKKVKRHPLNVFAGQGGASIKLFACGFSLPDARSVCQTATSAHDMEREQ